MLRSLMAWLYVPRQLASAVVLLLAAALLAGLLLLAPDPIMVWAKVNRLSQLLIGVVVFWLLLRFRDAAIGTPFPTVREKIQGGNLAAAFYYGCWVLGGLVMVGLWLGGG
jgi:hypothetical protein